ncbi:MAG: DUF4340 domain-containing protein [Acetobacteraceae bacterium]
MRPRTSGILAVVGVIVLVVGWYFGPNQSPAEREQLATAPLFFSDLAPRLEQASKIEIASAGKKFVIKRKGDRWGLPGLGFYPAEPSKVHSLLTGLTLLHRVSPRTSDPKEFATLGVADPTKAGSSGSLVAVSDAAGDTIVSLIVGHQRFATTANGPETLYVRVPGKSRSWLAEGPLSVDGEEDLWVDHSLANINHDQIVHVSVTRGEEKLAFAPRGGHLALVSSADHSALDSYKLEAVWRALESLSFSHVRPGPALPGKEFADSSFTTKDGTIITATLARDGKDLWARFAASGSGKDAKALAAKFGSWAFELGDWRESELAPKLADLVKAAAPAKP